MENENTKISVYILLFLSLITLVVSLSCQPNEKERYAKQLNLPEQNIKIMNQLQYDGNAKALMDELGSLPNDLKISQPTLDYLKRVAKDKKVSDSELSSQDTIKALNKLRSISNDTLQMYLNFGISDNITEYVNFVSGLEDKNFADYAISNKLCIQDKRFSYYGDSDSEVNLKRQFLKNPEKYTQQLFDFYMSDIGETDPEWAKNLTKITCLRDKTMNTDEALEDISGLANNPQNKSALDKVFGKGIERKMWPVAAERLVYKAFGNEFDVNNPFEGSEWTIYSRLADFQTKYKTEMDQDGVPGPKPSIIGINLVEEPSGYVIKSEADNKLDYALIKWVLRCNAVRLYGHNDLVFHHVGLAHDEGLDVYLQFDPVAPANFENVNLPMDSYKNRLASFAEKAQEYNVKWLSIGYELELWWKVLGSEGNWGWNDASYASRQNGTVDRVIKELSQIAHENYSGTVTYADWYASQWGLQQLSWHNMDTISMNMYLEQNRDELLIPTIESLKQKYNKPYIISETGSLTITEAENTGGDDSYTWRNPVRYDQEMQAQKIDRTLNLLYKAKIDGVFIYSWDRNANFNDQNRLGFGIWDYVNKEPKLSFWTVYKYYKE